MVTVCDNAHEELAGLGGVHWSVPDPLRLGTEEAFEKAFDDIAHRINDLAPRAHRCADHPATASILTIINASLNTCTSIIINVVPKLSAGRSASDPTHRHPTDSRRNPVSTETAKKPSVLFVCVHNAGRSQMAAAFLTTLGEGRIEVRSAGSAARGQGQPGRRRGHGRTRHRHVRRDPQDPHHRGRQGIRRRDHHGLRRHLPDLPRQALRGLGTRGPGRPGRRVRPPHPRRHQGPHRGPHRIPRPAPAATS